MENAELDQVRTGDRIEINSEVFTVQERNYYEKDKNDEWHTDWLRFELGNDYVLERGWGKWNFFQLVTKKGFFFTSTSSKNIIIESIKLI